MEREVGKERTALLAGLTGRVVEVGAGNGMNFSHYPLSVEEVVAVEPEPYLRAKAERAAATAPVTVHVRDGLADALPLESGSIDAAVLSLVLCSVPDQPRALAELRRVLKPGGELRFMEHVRADGPRKAQVQSVADRSGVGLDWLAVATARGTRCRRLMPPAFRFRRCAASTLGLAGS